MNTSTSNTLLGLTNCLSPLSDDILDQSSGSEYDFKQVIPTNEFFLEFEKDFNSPQLNKLNSSDDYITEEAQSCSTYNSEEGMDSSNSTPTFSVDQFLNHSIPNQSTGHHDYARSGFTDLVESKQVLLDIKLPGKVSAKQPGKTVKTTVNKRNYEHAKRKSNDSNKNAVAARLNRIKKKKYMEGLEKVVQKLKLENEQLRRKALNNKNEIENMSNELLYLKGVIENVEEISSLVKGIRNIPNIKLNEKFDVQKSVSDYCPVFSDLKRNEKIKEKQHGICLHVTGGSVSLELCHFCSQSVNNKSN